MEPLRRSGEEGLCGDLVSELSGSYNSAQSEKSCGSEENEDGDK